MRRSQKFVVCVHYAFWLLEPLRFAAGIIAFCDVLCMLVVTSRLAPLDSPNPRFFKIAINENPMFVYGGPGLHSVILIGARLGYFRE